MGSFIASNWNRFTTCILHQSVYVLNIQPTKFYTFQYWISIRVAEMVLRPQATKIEENAKKIDKIACE